MNEDELPITTDFPLPKVGEWIITSDGIEGTVTALLPTLRMWVMTDEEGWEHGPYLASEFLDAIAGKDGPSTMPARATE